MGTALFAVFVAGRLVAKSDIAMQALHSAWFRDIAVIGSLGVLYWWLGLARRTVNGSLGTMTFRSNARHEVNNAAIGESFGVPEEKVDQYLSDLDRATTTLMQDVATAGPTNRTLWAGLGIDLQFKWRSIATGVLIWSVVLIGAHLGRPRQAGVSAFLVISGLLALGLLSRINDVVEAWKRRGIEEALMVLTPHWPTELRVKGLLVSSMLQSQGGVMDFLACRDDVGVERRLGQSARSRLRRLAHAVDKLRGLRGRPLSLVPATLPGNLASVHCGIANLRNRGEHCGIRRRDPRVFAHYRRFANPPTFDCGRCPVLAASATVSGTAGARLMRVGTTEIAPVRRPFITWSVFVETWTQVDSIDSGNRYPTRSFPVSHTRKRMSSDH